MAEASKAGTKLFFDIFDSKNIIALNTLGTTCIAKTGLK